jgi:hypothetical protein
MAAWNAPWMSASAPQDVAEPDENRQPDASELQVIDELLQIDPALRDPWSHERARGRSVRSRSSSLPHRSIS